jgi:3-hydroxyisobutyrate dehydrogenase
MAHVLAADYTPLSAVDIFVKDLGLVLDTAPRASSAALAPRASDVHTSVSAGHGARTMPL